jgi:hypothetical protein
MPRPLAYELKEVPTGARDRFWANVTKLGPDDCWPWTGSLSSTGYGRLNINGRPHLAHRISYVAHVGPLPEGNWVIDHLCRVKHCVNPAHLDLVPSRVNTERGLHGLKWNPAWHDEAVKLWYEGLLRSEIADRLGQSLAGVCEVLSGRGIKAPTGYRATDVIHETCSECGATKPPSRVPLCKSCKFREWAARGRRGITAREKERAA